MMMGRLSNDCEYLNHLKKKNSIFKNFIEEKSFRKQSFWSLEYKGCAIELGRIYQAKPAPQPPQPPNVVP